MAIPDYVRDRFNTLLRAAKADHLALMECASETDGKPRYVLCAVNRPADDSFEFVPFGEMSASENPYDDYVPPTAEGAE